MPDLPDRFIPQTSSPAVTGRKWYATTSFWLVPWLVASILGVVWLWDYTRTAGSDGEVPPAWPGDYHGKSHCLVVALHPHCPCSRASADELARIAGAAGDRFVAKVYFFHPAGKEAEWISGDLRDVVAEIPNVEVRADPDGRKALKFGLLTSGAVALYGPDGRLVYTGGITDGRGHSGDNPGKLAVIAAMRGRVVETAREAVYGCEIHGPNVGPTPLVPGEDS